MALKQSNGKNIRKQKVNFVDSMMDTELKKKEDQSRKESFKIANQSVSMDVADYQISKLPISELYAAPFNNEWNDYSIGSPDKQYELDATVANEGVLTPIIVWKINKSKVENLYEDDNDNPYRFAGDKYMVLAGHRRTNSSLRVYEATQDEKYTKINAIIRENLTYEQAQYIIKVTNFSRELSTAEKRRNANFLHRTLINQGLKGSEVAKKIAKDSDSKLRTVQYYIKINNNIIDEFGDMLDNGAITQSSAYKLSSLTKDLQKWFYDTHKDDITDNLLKRLQPSYDRKEQLESLFKAKEYGENVNVNIEVPKDLEKKFRTMASKWISKQISK